MLDYRRTYADASWSWSLSGNGLDYDLFREGRISRPITADDFERIKKRAVTELDAVSGKEPETYVSNFKTIAALAAFGVPRRDCSIANLVRRAKGDLYVPIIAITPWDKADALKQIFTKSKSIKE